MGAKKRLFISAAIGGILLLLYGPGLIRWLELAADRWRLESEIASLKAQNQKLYEESKRLREDSSYDEAVARKQLGFVRPGETKIRLQRQQSKSTQQ